MGRARGNAGRDRRAFSGTPANPLPDGGGAATGAWTRAAGGSGRAGSPSLPGWPRRAWLDRGLSGRTNRSGGSARVAGGRSAGKDPRSRPTTRRWRGSTGRPCGCGTPGRRRSRSGSCGREWAWGTSICRRGRPSPIACGTRVARSNSEARAGTSPGAAACGTRPERASCAGTAARDRRRTERPAAGSGPAMGRKRRNRCRKPLPE